MGCGCGKAKTDLKQAIQQAKVNIQVAVVPSATNPVPAPIPVNQKTPRQLRIEARARRIAARNARVQQQVQQNLVKPV